MVKSIYSKKHGEHKLYFSSEDIDIVNSYEWVPKKDYKNGNFYAIAYFGRSNYIFLHVLLLNKKCGFDIDHINNNGLDNRRCNLRHVTHSQNMMNKNTKNNHKGVIKCEYGYRVRICKNGKTINGGKRFKTIDEAVLKYNELSASFHGEFGKKNRL